MADQMRTKNHGQIYSEGNTIYTKKIRICSWEAFGVHHRPIL